MLIMLSNVKLFTGNSNVEIAKSIANSLNIPVGNSEMNHFADGEIEFLLKESVRNYDIIIVQSISSTNNNSTNDSLMELLIMIDTFKRSNAAKIHVVIPYMGYARQDRKVGYNSSITAKLVAKMIESAGASSVLTLDLHSDQIQGFFEIPVDNLNGSNFVIDYFIEKNISDLVVVSPDAGGFKRANKLAKKLNAPVAMVNKSRPSPNISEIVSFTGSDVSGKNVIIYDDLIDTGRSIVNTANLMKTLGAINIYVCATHGLFSGRANEIFNNAKIQELIICNTVDIPNEKKPKKLITLDVGNYIARAITQIFNQEQLDDIFN